MDASNSQAAAHQDRVVDSADRMVRKRTFPLSATQRRLLSYHEFAEPGPESTEPGPAHNNIAIGFQVTGQLDRSALERAFAYMIDRHEILRTNFVVNNAGLLRAVVRDKCAGIEFNDLRSLPDHSAGLAATRLARDAVARPFILDSESLIRMLLLRTGPLSHVLLLVVHHTVFDGWSSEIFARQLSASYDAFAAGHTPDLAPVQLQFGDYVSREHLEPGTAEIDFAYWRGQLKGLPLLPTDYPRPILSSGRGATVSFHLSGSSAENLREFSREQRTSLFTCLLAGFQVLLSRYSGQQDTAIATPVARRDDPESEDLIGPLIDTVTIRQSLADDPAFVGLVDRTRNTILGALSHRSISFDRIVEELRPELGLDRAPICPAFFELECVTPSAWAMSGLDLMPIAIERGIEDYDLSTTMIEFDSEIHGVISYRTDLYAPETIQRMSASYISLLEHAVAEPYRKISTIPCGDLGPVTRTPLTPARRYDNDISKRG